MDSKKHDPFILAALGYLALPNILFLLTWIRPWLGIPVALAVIYGISRAAMIDSKIHRSHLDQKTLLIVIGIAFLWAALCGIGGWVPQSGDYIKHNVLFHDLAHLPWPVIYQRDSHDSTYLCYAVGYYLVPSGIAQLLGGSFVNPLSLVWAAAGLGLFFYWIATFHPSTPLRTLMIFLLYSSFGVAWFVVKRAHIPHLSAWPALAPAAEDPLLQMGIIHSYLDHWSKLYFTPQHGIAAWLGAATILELGWSRRRPMSAIFAWTTLLLWSPFVSLGLVPFLCLAALRSPLSRYLELVPLTSGGLLLIVMGIYYKAHQSIEHHGPIWVVSGGLNWIPPYLLFVFLEVLVPVGCVLLFDRRHPVLQGWRPLFLCAAGFLAALPLYKVGYDSDLRLQASGAALVLIALGFAACLNSPSFSFRTGIGLTLFTLFAASAAFPLFRPIMNLVQHSDDYSFQAVNQSMGINDMTEIGKSISAYDMSQQYLGQIDSIAYRWLLRR